MKTLLKTEQFMIEREPGEGYRYVNLKTGEKSVWYRKFLHVPYAIYHLPQRREKRFNEFCKLMIGG